MSLAEPSGTDAHKALAPSAWVARFAALISAGSRALDLASGSGRHALFLAARGVRVLAVDRDSAALTALGRRSGIEARTHDLEGAPWPLGGETFDAIVVTNYLHRPLFPHLFAALAPGGVLIYETFGQGNERYGRPSNPEFLLREGELLALVRDRLRVVAFEQGQVAVPKPAVVQRICAVGPAFEWPWPVY